MSQEFSSQVEAWEKRNPTKPKTINQEVKDIMRVIEDNEKSGITKDLQKLIVQSGINLQPDEVNILQEMEIGNETYGKHELLFFIKPEIFMSEKEALKELLELLDYKFQRYNIHVSGTMSIGAKRLDGVIDNHYGIINDISKNASRRLLPKDKKQMRQKLEDSGFEIDDEHLRNIIGGHEFGEKYGFDELDKIDHNSIRIDSGFYAQALEYKGEKIILVNGFHPEQIHHFTKNKGIICMVLHSDTDMKTLRNQMLGVTDASKAMDGSIRKYLYDNADKMGLKDIGRANNGCHLSAGLFEAFMEINNFIKLINTNFDPRDTLLSKQFLSKGIQYKILEIIKQYKKLGTDLIKETEEKDIEYIINKIQLPINWGNIF